RAPLARRWGELPEGLVFGRFPTPVRFSMARDGHALLALRDRKVPLPGARGETRLVNLLTRLEVPPPEGFLWRAIDQATGAVYASRPGEEGGLSIVLAHPGRGW